MIPNRNCRGMAYLTSMCSSRSYAPSCSRITLIASTSRDWQRTDPAFLLVSNGTYNASIPSTHSLRITGDQILVKPKGSTTGQWFSGSVHSVRRESVVLRFHPSFRWSEKQIYDIRFKLNRIPLRRQHQALDTAFAQDRMLFPSPEHDQGPPNASAHLNITNRLIANNPNQLLAVKGIVNQQPGAVPFVVFGP